MGIAEVVPKIPRIWRVLNDLADAAKQRQPACAILVDIPDFNLRLAKRLKALGVRVVAYVSPTVWAWREGRTKTIAARVDRQLCILPFEEKFLTDRGVNAVYVGNPSVEQVPAQAPKEAFRRALGLDEARPTLAVLPGSRPSEIRRLLPTMVEVAKRTAVEHPGLQLAIPIAPGLDRELVKGPLDAAGLSPVLVDGRAPEVVGACDVGLVASGTATLEAGLMGRPFVVIYRVAPTSYFVGKLLVRVPFFSLVNLLVGRRVVPELLQGDATPGKIVAELEPLWSGPARDECLRGLEELRTVLGPKVASERAADEVLAIAG